VALSKKGAYSKSKKNSLISCCELVVIGVLIGRKINMGISSVLNENQHFWVVAFVVLMLMSFVVPAVFVDVLRYYYFTKLEKMGLVTEDILKPDKP
jgi:hypothetical protein